MGLKKCLDIQAVLDFAAARLGPGGAVPLGEFLEWVRGRSGLGPFEFSHCYDVARFRATWARVRPGQESPAAKRRCHRLLRRWLIEGDRARPEEFIRAALAREAALLADQPPLVG